MKPLWLQYTNSNNFKIWLIHLFLRSSHIHTYLTRRVKIKLYLQRKCLNLMLPESAEVDRQHQPSEEERDERCLKTALAKGAKKVIKTRKLPLGMRSSLGPFCCCTPPSGHIEEKQFFAAIPE